MLDLEAELKRLGCTIGRSASPISTSNRRFLDEGMEITARYPPPGPSVDTIAASPVVSQPRASSKGARANGCILSETDERHMPSYGKVALVPPWETRMKRTTSRRNFSRPSTMSVFARAQPWVLGMAMGSTDARGSRQRSRGRFDGIHMAAVCAVHMARQLNIHFHRSIEYRRKRRRLAKPTAQARKARRRAGHAASYRR